MLGHRNAACFVTHCGANGAHEALARGVPVVPLPFFDDQHYIAARLEELYGYAERDAGYAPLRKADVRGGDEEKVARCVAATLRAPRDVAARLRDAVAGDDGAAAAAATVAHLAAARPAGAAAREP